MKIGEYTLTKLLGKGTMGEVYMTIKNGTNELFATKRVEKSYADRPQVKKYFDNEISILKELNHRNIVSLKDLKHTKSHYYIMMEYCNGGSLMNCLKKYISMYRRPFSEEIVQYLMSQIVNGLKYIHQHKIIHRDIKLDNILVKFYNEHDMKSLNMLRAHVKISDFGISSRLNKLDRAFTALGSPAYMDPLILKKLNQRNYFLNLEGYDQSVDIWSLGAACYEMVLGRRVFNGRNIQDLYIKVEGGNYSIPTNLSKEFVSFINGMLQYDSKKRLTSEQLSRHHFLTRNVRNFNKIDLKLVSNKIGQNGINVNTKKNQTIWDIFNEEDNKKLYNIPTMILDTNAIPDQQQYYGNDNNIQFNYQYYK